VTGRLSLFGKHLFVSIVITSIVVSSLGYLSLIMIRQFRKEMAAPSSPPAVIYAKFLHGIPKSDRVSVLEKINDVESRSHFQFWLVDHDGKTIFPKDAVVSPIAWSDISKPTRIFDFKDLGPGSYVIVQIDEGQSDYLLVKFHGRSNGNTMWLINLLSLIIAVILGTTLSFFILFYSLRQKAQLADAVISELQSGNLKARFPITKMDEAGRAMLRFNKMADEIERLVERLKTTENSRMHILQELAHDLRTPVASLKNMLDTLSNKSESMPQNLRTELINLSFKEVDYFENLVEDLLFLALTTEPRYKQQAKYVKLGALVEAEIESVEKSGRSSGKNILIGKDLQIGDVEIKGDPHLLHRLFRNALDNASYYATKMVTIRVKKVGSEIECVIEDDGPGFSTEALSEFGKRKFSRQFATQTQRRASIGLGSVIMSAVVSLHRGEISVQNRVDAQGKILGGQVRIILPAQ
jgi:signal transduction histidine kinase